MQECFRQYPEMYGSELDDDDDEVEEELRAQEAARALDDSTQEPAPVPGQPKPSQGIAQKDSDGPTLLKDNTSDASKPAILSDESGELTPEDLQQIPPTNKTA
jgi:intermembrane space import and assembly protein 40